MSDVRNSVEQICQRLGSEIEGIQAIVEQRLSIADSIPNFLAFPAAERNYQKLVWDEDTKPTLIEENKRIDRDNHFVTTSRPRIAAWIKSCITEDLNTVAETMYPENIINQQQSFKFGNSIIDTIDRIKTAYNSTISMNPRIVKEHYKNLLDNIEYTSGSTLDTFFQSFRDSWAMAIDSGSIISERDAIDKASRKLPERFNSYIKEKRIQEECGQVGPGMGFPESFTVFANQIKAYDNALGISNVSSKASKQSVQSFVSFSEPSDGILNKHTGEFVQWSSINMFTDPTTFGRELCEECNRNGYEGRHFRRFHKEAVSHMRSESSRGRKRYREERRTKRSDSPRERTKKHHGKHRGRYRSSSRDSRDSRDSSTSKSSYSSRSSRSSHRESSRGRTPPPSVSFKATK